MKGGVSRGVGEDFPRDSRAAPEVLGIHERELSIPALDCHTQQQQLFAFKQKVNFARGCVIRHNNKSYVWEKSLCFYFSPQIAHLRKISEEFRLSHFGGSDIEERLFFRFLYCRGNFIFKKRSLAECWCAIFLPILRDISTYYTILIFKTLTSFNLFHFWIGWLEWLKVRSFDLKLFPVAERENNKKAWLLNQN